MSHRAHRARRARDGVRRALRSACGFADESDSQTQLAAATIAGAEVVDLRPWVCPAGTCAPVIGDVLVYRQGSHLTTAYVRTLEPQLARQLVPAVEGG